MKKENKNRKEQNKYLVKTSILLLIIFIISPIVMSVTLPKGVEGKIYHMDGTTSAFSGIPVKITNLETEQIKIAETGLGIEGRYSIALNWENNPDIEIKITTPINEHSTVLKLEGVMRNVNLNIDLDFENVPPNITSNPITEAIAEYEYTYQIKSFDWNNDVINYSLIESPENMTISNEGLITWTPVREQFGNHTIKINASDEESYKLQEYELYVYVIKDAPNIISEPKTTVKRNELYEYAVEVIDEDYEFLEYEVFRGPEGMNFVDNVLTFQMNNNHEGEYIVIIDVKDIMNEIGRQIFILGIIEPEPRSSTKKSEEIITKIKNENMEIITSTKIFNLTNNELMVKKLVINNEEQNTLIIKETNPLIEGARTITTKAYKYFTIKPEKPVSDKVIITFSVSNKWLEETGLKPGEIILKKYVEEQWLEQYTKPLRQEETEYLFEAETQGLSLFAITHTEDAEPLPTPIQIHKAKINYLFIGEIKIIDEKEKEVNLNEKQIKELNNKIKITARNKENEEENEFETRIISNKILYQGSVTGKKSDDVTITLSVNKKEKKYETTIQDIINEKNLEISEEEISWLIKKQISLVLIITLLIILLIIYLTIKPIMNYKLKNETKQKNKE